MGLFSNTWKAVTGKVSENGAFGQAITSIWNDKTIDYTRNDYDLYRSLYYGVSMGGQANDMLIGAMFAKPIINSAAGFILGDNFTVDLGDEKYTDTEQDINDWIDSNQSTILHFVIHGLRDGDSYLYVDEYGNVEEVDAKGVTVILDPQTGVVIGYDIEEKYTLRTNGTDEKIVVVKQYRTDSVKYTQYPDNQAKRDKGTVIYNKVYTTEGPVTPTENQEFFLGDIVHRPLPIIHFANDQEPRSAYGNSELLNCLMGIRNYHAVVANATKGVINNANPIPVMRGVKNAEQIARQSNVNEDEDFDDYKVNWSPDSILFLENVEADAKYIQANGFMDDTGKLLEYYFMLIVEASETPEFVFGTAVSSSKASVSEQLPIVVAKTTRKRAQLSKPLTSLIESYIDRQIRLSNPLYLPFKSVTPDITIAYPDIINEDKTLTLEIVKYLNEAGILSDETSLKLLLNEKIADIEEELTTAREDNESQAEPAGAIPTELDRLQGELDATNNPTPPGDNLPPEGE